MNWNLKSKPRKKIDILQMQLRVDFIANFHAIVKIGIVYVVCVQFQLAEQIQMTFSLSYEIVFFLLPTKSNKLSQNVIIKVAFKSQQ